MSESAKSQGILAPDIFLREDQVNVDASEFIYNVVEFVNRLLYDGHLVFGEINDIAQATYVTDQYISQIINGGHSQYIHNVVRSNEEIGKNKTPFERIERLLSRCSDRAYLDIFQDFRSFLKRNPEAASMDFGELIESRFFEDLKAFDKRFYAADAKQRDADRVQYVRTSGLLRIIPDDRFQAELTKIIKRNPLFEQRGKDRQAALEKSPMYFAPRRLCEIAKLQFVRVTAGRPTGKPGVIAWGVMTSDGIRAMILGPNFAELFDKDRKVRLGWIEF